MRHELDASQSGRTTDQDDDSAARPRRSRELDDAELHQIVGGVQKVREAASPY